ncbi:MAG: signal peptidase II [Rhizobiaceae bacterium]|nr:signal peptidase II [Rhizobiaceae bacterium]MCV0404993.1 signal peptidase II [Rhizobiaceae bacterium]
MRLGLFGLAAIVVVSAALDQWSKHWVEANMVLHERIDLLPFFALFRAHNDGIAFSMLAGGGAALILLMIAVVGFIAWLAWRAPATQWIARLGFALILGGAAGNLIDRASLGYVIDYFLFHVGTWSFAIFNLADAFITVGAGLVILQELLSWLADRRAKAQTSRDSN